MHKTYAPTFLCSVLYIAGCNLENALPGGPGSGIGDTTQTVGTGGGTTPGDDQPGTDEVDAQAKAISFATGAATAVARAAAAIVTSTELQAILEGGQAMPVCPALNMELGATTILLTMDYGTGCAPRLFTQSQFGGTVDGTAFTAVSSFDFTLEEFTVEGETLQGTIAGGFTHESATLTLTTSVNLVLADGTTVRGTAEVAIDESTSAMTLADTTLTVSDETGTATTAELSGVRVDPQTSPALVPREGTVTITPATTTDPAPEDIFVITFTTQTPVDGTVEVN